MNMWRAFRKASPRDRIWAVGFLVIYMTSVCAAAACFVLSLLFFVVEDWPKAGLLALVMAAAAATAFWSCNAPDRRLGLGKYAEKQPSARVRFLNSTAGLVICSFAAGFLAWILAEGFSWLAVSQGWKEHVAPAYPTLGGAAAALFMVAVIAVPVGWIFGKSVRDLLKFAPEWDEPSYVPPFRKMFRRMFGGETSAGLATADDVSMPQVAGGMTEYVPPVSGDA